MFEKIINSSLIKKNFNWKLSICQHPMYLLIDEDRGVPEILERIPPWGAPNAKEYIERVKRNLRSLERYPELRIDYDFSAVEIEAICREFPEVGQKMKEMYDKGKLSFVNGSFSQAHLQVFGSESNWRQFEMGLQVYKKLFDKNVEVYVTQETGVHEQLPQILNKFGYKFVALPAFYSNLEIIDGKFELGFREHPQLIHGDEFVEAVSPDGSSIPLYLECLNCDYLDPTGDIESYISREIVKDLYAGPPFWRSIPDMEEITSDLYNSVKKFFDFTSYEEALQERLEVSPPRAKARLYSYWSYIEGMWADELLRKNKEAEETAIMMEALDCLGTLAGYKKNNEKEIEKVWHTILKYQHHDVYWHEVTDLRRKAINYLGTEIDKCQEIMTDISDNILKKNTDSIAVFNVLPTPRKTLVEDMINLKGNKGVFQQFGDKKFGFLNLPAGGYRSFSLAENSCCKSIETSLPDTITTDFYTVEFTSDGLIKQIETNSGKILSNKKNICGGEIKGMISGDWVDNRQAECNFYKGDVAYIMERSVELGDIPVKEKYYFYRKECLIKVEVEFDFDGNEVGNFWLDETKINIYYPTEGSEIYHDIPFGYVKAREKRPLLAINWLYNGGLVYVNRGNCKHWVKDGVIGNVIAWGAKGAWGGKGKCFGNRQSGFNFILRGSKEGEEERLFDLRLYGKQTIEYFLIPQGQFDGNEIVKKVRDLTFPVFITKGNGEKSFYRQTQKNLNVTSLYKNNNEIWVRGYKLPANDQTELNDWEIFNMPLSELQKLQN